MTPRVYSSADAAQLLGVSTAYLRSQAKVERWGAHKLSEKRSWYFDSDAIDGEVTRRAGIATVRNLAGTVAIDPVLDSADLSTWELERQLLIAQASAAEHAVVVTRLQADIEIRDQRIIGQDQTISGLQSELGRLRRELGRMAAFVSAATAEHI